MHKVLTLTLQAPVRIPIDSAVIVVAVVVAVPKQRQRGRVIAGGRAAGSAWCQIAPRMAKVLQRNVLLMEEGGGAHFQHVAKVRKAALTSARSVVFSKLLFEDHFTALITQAHGGGKRCGVDGCGKSARGATGLCKAHGGGKQSLDVGSK